MREPPRLRPSHPRFLYFITSTKFYHKFEQSYDFHSIKRAHFKSQIENFSTSSPTTSPTTQSSKYQKAKKKKIHFPSELITFNSISLNGYSKLIEKRYFNQISFSCCWAKDFPFFLSVRKMKLFFPPSPLEMKKRRLQQQIKLPN